MQVISLLFLIGAIALGFARKLNVGVVALGLSLILALIGGVSTKVLFAGFPSKLFLTILGTMLYFSILQENKTIEKLSKKLVSLVGNKTFLIPVMLYVVAFVMSAAGPGAISVQSIMILFGVTLAVEIGANPIFFAIMAYLGAVGGTSSPIALTGILISELAEDAGISHSPVNIFLGVACANVVLAVIFYIYFKGYKLKAKVSFDGVDGSFNKTQTISAISMLVFMLLTIVMKYDVGLTAFTISLVLILIKCGNLSTAIKRIPWNVMILICGVSVLMAATQEMGGIDLLSSILSSVMNKNTATPIMAFIAGLMSWFSSANGVVFPTLVPTISGIVDGIGGGVTINQLLMAMISGGTATGISPFSTGGSLTLAAASQGSDNSDAQQQALFGKLILLSVVNVFVVIIFAFCGGYKLFG